MIKHLPTKISFRNLKTDTLLIYSGHLFFFVLLLFSIYFYKERILFTDSAFQYFKIINFEKINIEASRYGAILPQLPTILFSKLGLNIKLLTIVFSCSFVLLYYVIYVITVHLLKNAEAGFIILLVLTACISQSFFHPVTETHQSLVFTTLLYAVLQFKNFRYTFIQPVLAVSLISISFLAHPVALYTNVFVIGYVAITNKQLKSVSPYFLLLITVILAVAKVMLTASNSYEGRFFAELFQSSETILSLSETQSLKFFVSRATTLYLAVIIMEVIVVVHFVRRQKYLKLLWTLGVQIVFLFITVITYNNGDATLMMERAFMPLSLFAAIPFMAEIKHRKESLRFLKPVFLILIVLFGLNRIYNQGKSFKLRTTFNQELLKKTAQYPNRKFIMNKAEMDNHFLAFWSNSFETLILSTIDVNVPTQTIFLANQTGKYKKYTEQPGMQFFLGADFWLEWNIESLNPKYFNLPANKPYLIISMDDLENNTDK
nr:hypothetical protein [uncultured Draconibacterium sp.]